MEKLPRRVYTSEFRRQAVEMITRDGLGDAEAARRLPLSPKRLTDRVRRARGADSPGGAAAREMAEDIDLFYHRRRRPARLGYLSPAAYTQQFMQQRQAA